MSNSKKEQLTLEHLAPYLPFRLEVLRESIHGNEKHIVRGLSGYNIFTQSNGTALISINKIKPILRPLSDLTKEISFENNKITPLEKIGQHYIGDGSFDENGFGWGQSTGGGDEQDYWLTIEKENSFSMVVWCGNKNDNGFVVEQYKMPYDIFNELIKWHFDVFELIEKGLAYDINAIK